MRSLLAWPVGLCTRSRARADRSTRRHGASHCEGSGPARNRVSPIIAVIAERGNATNRGADSTGRCNSLGERLRWCHPAEGLSRASVELGGDGVEVRLGQAREVGTLGQVLAEQAVGVLVGAPLPRAVRVAEVDGDAGLDREGEVLGHLLATVPGERATELPGQGRDPLGEGIPDRGGGTTGGQGRKEEIAGPALDEGGDRRAAAGSDEEIALSLIHI